MLGERWEICPSLDHTIAGPCAEVSLSAQIFCNPAVAEAVESDLDRR